MNTTQHAEFFLLVVVAHHIGQCQQFVTPRRAGDARLHGDVSLQQLFRLARKVLCIDAVLLRRVDIAERKRQLPRVW